MEKTDYQGAMLVLYLIALSVLVLGTQACPSLPEDCMPCSYGYEKDKDGCEICRCQPPICKGVECALGTICQDFMLSFTGHKTARCIDPTMPHRCHQPMDPGPCDSNEERFYYDHKEKICKPFVFGGCQGNRNNFLSYEDCDMTCKSGICEDITRCELECEHGLEVNELDCELCQCRDPNAPEAPEEPPPCDDITCELYCPSGRKKDPRGCDICECEQECNDFMCMLFCEDGFMKDENGCDVCRCAGDIQDIIPGDEDLENCPAVLCMMYCAHGYERDAGGCPMCKCRPESDAGKCDLLTPRCKMFCEYGYVKDSRGCPICKCQNNPCDEKNFSCPEPFVCQPIRGRQGDFHPNCVDPEKAGSLLNRLWCLRRTMQLKCAKHCEHGYYTDKYGCDTCDCRAEDKPECSEISCMLHCEYGFRFDPDGCQTCECLTDPCEGIVCISNEVCEQKKLCKECPAIEVCLAQSLVRRIKIILSYVHPPIWDLNIAQFEEAVENSISQLMAVDEEYIRGISVRTPIESTTTVELHVVTYGDMDLVRAFQKLREYIQNDNDYASIFFNGINFAPSESSIEVAYSSDPEFEAAEYQQESTDDDDDNTTMIIIIIVCVVAGVLLIVGTVVSIVVCKSKKKSKKEAEMRHSRVSYHQAPNKESVNA